MKSFAKIIYTKGQMELESDFARQINNIELLLKREGILKGTEDKKIGFMIINEDNGVNFIKAKVKTYGGYIVDDKDNTSSYHQEDLIDAAIDFINRQKNMIFIIVINEEMIKVSYAIFKALKNKRIKVKESVSMEELLKLNN